MTSIDIHRKKCCKLIWKYCGWWLINIQIQNFLVININYLFITLCWRLIDQFVDLLLIPDPEDTKCEKECLEGLKKWLLLSVKLHLDIIMIDIERHTHSWMFQRYLKKLLEETREQTTHLVWKKKIEVAIVGWLRERVNSCKKLIWFFFVYT